ncbi:MAG: ATP-binding cassette domain-containing protein [Deltaproteobacteria bacterium]|nr:ATP-binding cassette domain-containing protein [Deltaproteobacteria bacterium]
MLKLSGITKIFNSGTLDEKRAMDDINLTVKKGDFVTVVGSNGAGKSTLLNIISGTYNPDKGTILIGNQDVTRYPDYKMAKYVARVFQSTTMGTAEEMTIEENLCLAEKRGKRRGLMWGVTKSRRSRYGELLKFLELGLEDRTSQKVGLLSGGQRQSLTLLMTTLAMPKLLLLDEHTAALDPRTAEKIMALTEKMVRENNLTTLMVTHNMNQALQYGNRMIMLHQGKVQLDIKGEEKEEMTTKEIISKFGQTLRDETLLSV